ncbi:hypothetical protein OQX63_17975 [Pedobacter sp. PF22-3]|uniref:hypothetical protein n=1 Tax=Pedobacter sp. PF22-3 TaxID=2994467 RepID=UPI00224638A2|nr:hypothetical protein [Pedobacter sp. PF22-3]MCX2495384.1 hypothetical protein [Pedobacter sp. PF22-3]
MPYQTLDTLKHLVKIALEDSDILKGIREAEISQEEAQKLILNNDQEIWRVVSSELLEYEALNEQQISLRTANRELAQSTSFWINEEKWKSIILTPIFFILLAFVLSPTIKLKYVQDWANGSIYRWTTNGFFHFLIGFIFLFGMLGILIWLTDLLIQRYVKRQSNKMIRVSNEWKRTNSELVGEYSAREERLESLTKLIDQNMIEKSIKERLRYFINQKLEPSYSRDLPDLQTKGLGEVIDVSRTIDTDAKIKLDFLLRTMPGGSIGIAGSRGAGKSTLIHSYCGAERNVTQINDRLVLPVMTSATVKYDFRDFILNLFASTCESVLILEKAPRDEHQHYLRSNQKYSTETVIMGIRILLQIFLIYIGIALITFSLSLRAIHSHYHPVTASSVVKIANKKTDSLKNSLITKLDKSKTVGDTIQPTRKPEINFFDYYLATISEAKELPAQLFSNGILSLLGWVILTISFGTFPLSYYIRPRLFRILMWDQYMADRLDDFSREVRDSAFEKSPHAGTARKYLKKIKFQQSFTSGWSGGLKLPIAFEGSVQKSTTIEERAMSNPEIVDAFVAFLNTICTDYQVVIGIDELDKMDSEVDAKNFLNEIKAIFGLQRCFFLVSVSENAMFNFERRGMPFRDVFDSSFDSIIYVDYLNLKDTVSLLQRRVIGRPILFFYLAYCLSAGLPRDIIRVFRDITRISQFHKKLDIVCNLLIKEDVRNKLFAISSIVRKLPNTLVAKLKFLDIIDTSTIDLSIIELQKLVINLYKLRKELEEDTSGDSNAIELCYRLKEMIDEVYSYLGYILTIWELFSKELDLAKIDEMETNQSFVQIAKAKQSLSGDFKVSQKLVVEVRKRNNLSKLTT